MIFPATQDRGTIVFLVGNKIPYGLRLKLGFGLILLGLGLQAATLRFLPGLPFLILGNLLLLVRGFNNRVDFGKFDPSANWERVPAEKLDQLFALDQRIRRWDISALDWTNPLGGFLFIMMTGGLITAAVLTRGAAQILSFDFMVLLLPHWITGVRSVMRQPRLMKKAEVIRGLLREHQALSERHSIQLLFLLKGEGKIPADIKFKIEPKDHPPEFLGLYGQVVLNQVQGKPYPYFYVVLVAKKGFDLKSVIENYQPPAKMVHEFKLQADVEVLVIRQATTKTSGYHTKPPVMNRILREGISLVEQAVAAP